MVRFVGEGSGVGPDSRVGFWGGKAWAGLSGRNGTGGEGPGEAGVGPSLGVVGGLDVGFGDDVADEGHVVG